MKFFKKLFGIMAEESRELQVDCLYKHKFDENKPMRLVTKAISEVSYRYKRVSTRTGRKTAKQLSGNTDFLLDNYDCIQ